MVLMMVIGLVIASFFKGSIFAFIGVAVLIGYFSDITSVRHKIEAKAARVASEHTCDFSEKNNEITKLASLLANRDAQIQANENNKISWTSQLARNQEEIGKLVGKSAKLEMEKEILQERIAALEENANA